MRLFVAGERVENLVAFAVPNGAEGLPIYARVAL